MARDYKNCPYIDKGNCMGGKLEEYPDWKNNLRSVLFPQYRRVVEVRISTYMGISPGAVHYYVSFEIEEDPILIPKDDGFLERTTWDFPMPHKHWRSEGTDFISDSQADSDKGWEKFKDNFMDIEYAKRFAIIMAERKYPVRHYKVRHRWFEDFK